MIAGPITLHDATSGAQLAELTVGGLPWGVAAAQGRAYVANFGDGTVSIIDLPGRRVLKTVPVGSYPVAAVAETDGAYVVHLNGNITHLDSQGQVLAQARVDAPDARGIAWDSLRNRVYVGSREGRIIVADASHLTAGRTHRAARPGVRPGRQPGNRSSVRRGRAE